MGDIIMNPGWGAVKLLVSCLYPELLLSLILLSELYIILHFMCRFIADACFRIKGRVVRVQRVLPWNREQCGGALISAVDGGEWPASRSGSFTSGDKIPYIHRVWGWGPQNAQRLVAKESLCPCWKSNPGRPARSLSHVHCDVLFPGTTLVRFQHFGRRCNVA